MHKEETKEETKIEVIKEQVDKQKLNLSLEDSLRRYFINKEIVSERNEENKLLKEKIEQEFEALEGTEFIIELPSGEFAKVFKKPRIKEVLDKDALANHLQIAKDELKTPWDFSKLAEKFLEEAQKNKEENPEEQSQKKMSRLIVEFTETQTEIQTKISKTKNKPKKKKEKK